MSGSAFVVQFEVLCRHVTGTTETIHEVCQPVPLMIRTRNITNTHPKLFLQDQTLSEKELLNKQRINADTLYNQ